MVLEAVAESGGGLDNTTDISQAGYGAITDRDITCILWSGKL